MKLTHDQAVALGRQVNELMEGSQFTLIFLDDDESMQILSNQGVGGMRHLIARAYIRSSSQDFGGRQ